MACMPRSRPFAQVDVFSAVPYRGNPLAVVLDAEDLSDAQMRDIARWTNLSETTFLMPARDPRADYRVRIFTPAGEVPFAGHPTLGSAHAWAEHGGPIGNPAEIIQECAAGLVRVRRTADALAFAAPDTRRSGPLEAAFLDSVIAAFGIGREQVMDHQWVDNGPGWAVLRLGSAQEVLDLRPDLSLIPDAMVGAIGAYPAGSSHDFEMRTFAPGVGVAEDPVCGSMNASVGQWLTRTGQVHGGYRVSQGALLGRAGDITITVDPDGTVWVHGATHTLFQGTALI
jgi:PhzF family phenazine biosynthesis protein